MCSRHLVAVCVRLFLERREAAMQQFAAQFKDFNLVHDEKVRELVICSLLGQRVRFRHLLLDIWLNLCLL